ncbi:SUN domain-containing protein 3 isoform X2 [Harpegnathos saltator]|uniref:SUN domain-containing protein 3 isoform X2 n=1 Tax=Harpegnathos saltator TaxID=610380 RepID=UPI000DBEE45E|nr:SUN domain-containing protein 3 isoform X2 [Harpegnathos saltator]
MKTILNYQSGRRWLQGSIWMWSLFLFLFLFGCWYMTRYSLLSAVYGVSKTVTGGFLSVIKVDNNESKIAKEKSNNNDILLNRIMIFEKEQIYQKEYLMNITFILDDYQKRQMDFQKECNDKNADKINKINELRSLVNNELKVIKHELKKLQNLSTELQSLIINYTKTQVEEILSDLSYFPPKILKKDLMENNFVSDSDKDVAVLDDNVSDSNVLITEEYVRRIVKEILQIYDADKTGQVDYALESAGGEIISTRDTQEYNIKSRAINIFGFLLYYQSYNNDPRIVIQKNSIHPGSCWAFQNFPGYLLIRLRSAIYVTGFTLEHVSRLIVPAGNMSSAPKNFNVWGLTDENDPKPVMFGDYEFTYFEYNLQYFPIQNTGIERSYEYIELRIQSNHGQLDYTCLYKFRIHGRRT